MKILYNAETQEVSPYPRSDDQPVQGLDPKYLVLDKIDAPQPEITSQQYVTFAYIVDLDLLEYRQVWTIHDIPPSPNWDGLNNAVLGGVLYPMYARLTQASFVDPVSATSQSLANANNIAVAAGKIDQSVQVTRVESAVAASFGLLYMTSDYRFTADEIALWNTTTDSLNFSEAIHLS